MYNQAAQSYLRTQQTTASPRELEASLLIKAAARLQSVRDDWSTASDMLDSALDFNRRLWTILATAATSEDNPLPAPVKANIGSLAIFVFQRSLDVIVAPDPAKLTALISINANLAAGLRGSSG